MGFFNKKSDPKPEVPDLDLRTVAGVSNVDRETRISGSLAHVGVENFPDNPHNTWTLLETRHLDDHSYALVEPDPNDVGYDRFVFVFRFQDGDAAFATTAIYCLEDETFGLLATTPECVDPLPRALIW